MGRPAFQNLRVYTLAEDVADVVWSWTTRWPVLARDVVGKQLIRAADSIGANIAEGYGRGTAMDNRRFVRIAWGSLNGTLHFLRRTHRRDLISVEQTNALKPLLDELGPKLNAYLRSIAVDRS